MDSDQLDRQPPIQFSAPVLDSKRDLKKPLLLMFWPIILLMGGTLLYALINFIFPDGPPAEDSLFGETHPVKSMVNVVLYFIGAATVLLGPISFIIGLVMLLKGIKK